MQIDPPDGLDPVPTLDGAYRPVEAWNSRIAQAPPGGSTPATSLSRVDSYLLHSVLRLAPGRRVLIASPRRATDAAAEALALGLFHPGVTRAVALEAGGPDVTLDLDDFSREEGAPNSIIYHPLGTTGTPEMPRGVIAPLIFLAAGDVDPVRALAGWLAAAPTGWFLVHGLGPAGTCPMLRALAASQENNPGLRFWLPRELAPALVTSRLALVAPAGAPDPVPVLDRIVGLFRTNFDYVRLLRSVCDEAIGRALKPTVGVVNTPLPPEDLSERMRHADEQIARLREMLHRECVRPWSKDLVLQAGRRVAQFARRNRAMLAPPGSVRERIGRRLMAAQRKARGRSGATQ